MRQCRGYGMMYLTLAINVAAIPLTNTNALNMDPKVIPTQVHRVKTEPYYASQGSEIELFEAAYRNQIPILLKGRAAEKPVSWNTWLSVLPDLW